MSLLSFVSIRNAACLLGLVMVGALVGCGADAGPPRFHVSGKVTYKGQPVPRGVIMFAPDSTKGNSGPAGTADIIDGVYDTSKSGQGTGGGAYVARISGFDGVAKPENELPLGKPLFQDYTIMVDLPKEPNAVQDLEVRAGGGV